MIECQHFKESGRADGGTCLAGLHDGKPSFGVCQACPHKDKPLEEIPKTFRARMRKKGCGSCKPVVVTYESTNALKQLISE